MGTGYTRNDTSNNIADGNVVNASDLDGEFDAVESAFATSGHTHDGTAAEGGPVTVVGPAQDVVVSGTNVNPKTTNTLDLGTASLKYKDAYLQGNITVDGTVDGRDVAADGTKLDGVEASADVTDTANVTAAGALMDSELTDLAGVKGVTISTLQVKPSEGAFVDGDKTKLDAIEASATADQTDAEIRAAVEAATDSNVFTDADHTKLNGIEASADVTDATNVTAAGALMDSEVTNLAQVKAFDSADYATAAQGTTADAALPKSGGTMTGTIASFESTGIDDNATSTALTIDSSQNATFAGDVTIDTNANGATLTIRSPNQTWSGGENLGGIDWYTEDPSGAGPANIAGIKCTSSGSNTLPVASLEFQTSNASATPVTALTLTGVGNATFAGDINFSGSAPNVLLDADNDRLVVSGGDATSSGANIIFYGDNHATNANKMIFRNSATTALTINATQDATFAGDVTLSNSATPTLKITDTTNTCTLRAQSGNSSAQIGTSTAHSFGVQTDGTNALTIDTSQNATFAGTVNFYGIRSNTAGSGAYATHIGGGGTWKFRVATSGSSLNWDWENVGKARMLTTGDWQNVNNSYGAISDRTLKQDITDARSQWDDIKAIQLRNFRYINEVEADENAKEHLGVIAQEVQEVSAGLVTQSSEEDHLGVNYMLMCIKAVGALQEAMTKIEDLEARVATLESAE